MIKPSSYVTVQFKTQLRSQHDDQMWSGTRSDLARHSRRCSRSSKTIRNDYIQDTTQYPSSKTVLQSDGPQSNSSILRRFKRFKNSIKLSSLRPSDRLGSAFLSGFFILNRSTAHDCAQKVKNLINCPQLKLVGNCRGNLWLKTEENSDERLRKKYHYDFFYSNIFTIFILEVEGVVIPSDTRLNQNKVESPRIIVKPSKK